MKLSNNEKERKRAMENGLRRQIGTEANRRHLRQLPIFRIDLELPSRLDDLLDQIDLSEQQHTDRRD